MKALFISTVILLSSCSFYLDESTVTISNISKGVLVVTSSYNSFEMNLADLSELDITLEKGVVYYVTFYPILKSNISRFPLGGVITPGEKKLELKAELGPLTRACNILNLSSHFINHENVLDFKQVLEDGGDPWIYDIEDILFYLKDLISIHGIKRKRTFIIPDLDRYRSWIPENLLFSCWYSSIQNFYDPETESILRVEIDNSGEYNSFIVIK